MAESLSRRKYSKLVKFLTETMENPKTSPRVRLTAALRLDDILARNEARADRIADRKARALALSTETAAERAKREADEAARATEEAQEAAAREEAERLRRLVDDMLHPEVNDEA